MVHIHSTKIVSMHIYLLSFTCVGIHPGRVEPASLIQLITFRAEALHARRSCASSLETHKEAKSFLHLMGLKTHDPEMGSRSALIVFSHVVCWPPAHRRHVSFGAGRKVFCCLAKVTKPLRNHDGLENMRL